MAGGLQYAGMDGAAVGGEIAAGKAAASNCFYSAYGMMDSFDSLIYDATNMFAEGNFNWFNTAMLNPFNLTGDLSVVYK